MTLVFRIILICLSLITAFYVLRRIRKEQLNIDDAIFWIIAAFGLLVLSIFPGIVKWAANLVGVYSEINFIFAAFIFVLILKLFKLTVELSQLKHKLQTLVQEYAVDKAEDKNKENKE